jgi:hypothetical protein
MTAEHYPDQPVPNWGMLDSIQPQSLLQLRGSYWDSRISSIGGSQ